MQTANSFGLIFIQSLNKKPQEDKYPIYAKITVNGDESEMSLKMYVHPKDWNGAKGVTKAKTPELLSLNTHLALVNAKLTSIFRQMELDDEHLTAQRIKLKYLNLDEPTKKHTMKWLFEEHNTKMVGSLAPGTLKNYRTTYDYLTNFLNKIYHGDVLLRHLEYNFIEDYKTYILEYPLKEHDPCQNNGVMKHLERLKKVVNWGRPIIGQKRIHLNTFL